MTSRVALGAAAAAGFIALSYEMVWYRVIAFASWGLPGAFGLLLAAYLLGLAVGSWVAGRSCADGARAGDARLLRRLGGFAFFANLAAWLVVPGFSLAAKLWDWPAALVLVATAAALLGAILPLVAHFGIRADDRAGMNLSYVYLANILGSAAGSLVTGFVLFDLLSIQGIGALLGLAGMGLAGALLFLAEMPRASRGVALVGLVFVSLLLLRATPLVYDRLWERLLYKSKLADDARFAEVIETRSGVITVTADGTVYGGGAYDGRFNTSLRWDKNGILRAYGVAALHPAPRRLLMIGLASGSWAKVLSTMPGLERLTIVEINPGYVTLLGRHPEVEGVLRDPTVEIVIDDGRRWLHRHADRFDVIVMNTTWHWRAHITNLLSAEFMQLARDHLQPGGVFYFNTTSSADVQRTAAEAFPHALRVYNFLAVSDAPVAFDRGRWRSALEAWRLDGAPAVDVATDEGRELFDDLMTYPDTLDAPPIDSGLESRASLLARLEGVARRVTDDNMLAEWRGVECHIGAAPPCKEAPLVRLQGPP